jgi:hypothetical protein
MHMSRLTSSFAPVLRIVLAAASLILAMPRAVYAQAEPAGLGPGTYTQVGATFSSYQNPYGQRQLGGAAAFLDANLYRRIGVEAEFRMLRLNEAQDVHNTTYLVGPRISAMPRRFRPYGKVLFGRGEFYFPYHYAKGSYVVVAPGFGVDWQVAHTPLFIRLIDVELQQWPGFTFGSIRPYGISTGVALRVF